MSVYWQAFIDAFRLLLGFSPEVWEIIARSLQVSGISTLLAAVIGVPVGYVLGASRFGSRNALLVLVNTAMGFPPVVVGLFVYMSLSRTGPLGMLELLFTPTSMIIAQVVIAAPLVAGVTTAAIAAVPSELRLQVRSLGASPAQEALAVITEARRGVAAAVIAGFGGIISEVGAVQIVGGNIEGSTRVMTTAILYEVRRGEFGMAMAWSFVLIGIALVANVLLTTWQHAGARYER